MHLSVPSACHPSGSFLGCAIGYLGGEGDPVPSSARHTTPGIPRCTPRHTSQMCPWCVSVCEVFPAGCICWWPGLSTETEQCLAGVWVPRGCTMGNAGARWLAPVAARPCVPHPHPELRGEVLAFLLPTPPPPWRSPGIGAGLPMRSCGRPVCTLQANLQKAKIRVSHTLFPAVFI